MKLFRSGIIMLVVILACWNPSQKAYSANAPMKYRIDYVIQQKLYKKGNQLTILTTNLEWPKYYAGSDIPGLQKFLSENLLDNVDASSEKGLDDYISSLGTEIDSLPEGENLKRQYIKLNLQQLGGEEGKYMSFYAKVYKRNDDKEKPEVCKQMLFTYDFAGDRVYTTKELLVANVLPGKSWHIYLVDMIYEASSHLVDYFYVTDLPDQACLMPYGVVFNLKGTSDWEGCDKLVFVPMSKMNTLLRPSIAKWLKKGKKIGDDYMASMKQASYPEEPLDTNKIYDMVEQKPEFNGGERALGEFLAREVRYPDYESLMNISGRVVVEFVVERDGTISMPSVISPVSPSLDREAVNAIMAMPKWIPGKQNDIPVRTRMFVPVNFKITK